MVFKFVMHLFTSFLHRYDNIEIHPIEQIAQRSATSLVEFPSYIATSLMPALRGSN